MKSRTIYFHLLLGILASLLTPLLTTYSVDAVSGSDWRAGNIIDDGPFENADAMTVSQIQNWLDIRLQNCDPNGTQRSELSGGNDYNNDGTVTRAEYGKTYGNPAPFTCLNKYYEVPKTSPSTAIPASNYGKSTIPAGAKSAAQLIYDAGKAYNISPKVLLVKLGTESAGPLTSDTWPFKSQYTYAMGAHCPDSGPGGSANCDVNYSGFSLQMREAAKLLRDYLDNMTQSWWTYKRPGSGVDQTIDSTTKDLCSSRMGVQNSNCVGWNVPRSCGGTVIYIQTKATAALYTYTPYQPNSASLSSYPGTGDSCSSYGNRNFWFVYSNWFGSTHLPQVFRTSASTKTYLLSGSSYFYIPNPDILDAYGYTTKDVGVVRSSDIDALAYAGTLQRTARFGGNEIYLVDSGKKFHFTSQTMLNTYGYAVGDESSLDANLAYSLPNGGSVSTIINQTDNYSKYYMEGAKKRHIANPTVYNSQGSPVYSSVTPTNLSRAYVDSIADGAPLLEDSSFAKDTDGSVAGYWDGSNLQPINKTVLANLGASTYASSGVSMLPKTSTVLNELVKTDDSHLYLLDSKAVYKIDVSQLANTGLASTDFSLVDSAFISKLNSLVKPFKPVVRVNSSSAIYLVDSGSLRHMTSRRALDDYNYTVNDAVNINARSASHFTTSSDDVVGTGTLTHVDGTGKVFLINSKNSKVYIPSPAMLQAYGYSYTKISNMPSASLNGYPTTGTLSNFIHPTSNPNEVWLIDMFHVRRIIPASRNTASGYAINPSGTSEIDDNLLSTFNRSLDLTLVIRAEHTDPVYLVKDGKKHWVKSRAALSNEGYTLSDVSAVSAITLNKIPTGADIN
jgi:hypothetical protein